MWVETNIQNGIPCFYCKIPTIIFSEPSGRAPKNALTLDHIIQKSLGGLTTRFNLVPCCNVCNNKRGNMDFIEFGIKSILKREGII